MSRFKWLDRQKESAWKRATICEEEQEGHDWMLMWKTEKEVVFVCSRCHWIDPVRRP